MPLLFSLRNFTQSYSGHTVLNIPQLDLPRGEFIVFLGKSGCGKTTLMETLSLLRKPEKKEFAHTEVQLYDNDDQSYDFRDIWRNRKLATRIRSHNFSFMFQDSVFFEDTDIGANVILPRVIQQEHLPKKTRYRKFIAELRDQAATSAETLNLSPDKLKERINIQSGGQVQRFAFVRSVLPDFQVLFADEPTGNLDEANADFIFRRMREFLAESDGSRTILVVTHQKDLAVRYADRIVCIAENGTVSPENIFTSYLQDGKKVWHRATAHDEQIPLAAAPYLAEGQPASTLIAELERVISTPVELPLPDRDPKKKPPRRKRIRHQRSPHQHLFVRTMLRNRDPDFRFRIGNPYFWVLFFFLALGLTALGISHLSLKKLEAKMKDPYINWLYLYPLLDYDINTMAQTLDSTAVKQRFGIEYVSTSARFALYILPKKWLSNGNPRSPDPTFGETMDFNSVIARKVYIGDHNEYTAHAFPDSELIDLGVRDSRLIVTREMMTSLGYRPDEPYVFVRYGGYDTPIPVMTVVKDLPHKNSFLCTPGFYYAKNMENSLVPDIQGTARVLLYDSLKAQTFATALRKNIEKKGFVFWPENDERKVHVEKVPYEYGTCRTARVAVISRLKQKEEWDKFQGIIEEQPEDYYDAYVYESANSYTPSYAPASPYDAAAPKDAAYADGVIDTTMVPLYDEPAVSTEETTPDSLFLISLTPVLHKCQLDTLIAETAKETGIEAYRYFPVKETYENVTGDKEFIAQHHNGITIYLKSLDHIRELRSFLLERFHYELSIESIENLENYRSVARLTTLLGLAVILIILMFLAVYVVYILYVHLHRIRKLLGLLLAFGAAPSALSAVYRWVVLSFIVKTLVCAVGTAFGAYYLYLWYPTRHSHVPVPKEYLLYFANPIQIALVVGVLVVSLISSHIILVRFLRHQPGDLLYDRIEKK